MDHFFCCVLLDWSNYRNQKCIQNAVISAISWGQAQLNHHLKHHFSAKTDNLATASSVIFLKFLFVYSIFYAVLYFINFLKYKILIFNYYCYCIFIMFVNDYLLAIYFLTYFLIILIFNF